MDKNTRLKRERALARAEEVRKKKEAQQKADSEMNGK